MSIRLVENEIRRFLSSEEPEVICISGQWGVGKTFAWRRFLGDAHAAGQIALKRYSYVSLFGINSLDEFRYSIFENSVKSSEIGVEPSLETLRSNTVAAAERLGRKSLWFIQQMPLIRNYVGGLGPVWFLSVRDTIVCVDDIERRGADLSPREVLGLVSTLKEQKACKVVLILNSDAQEEDKDEFRKYYEKVVDTSLKFAPSAEECARIALTAGTKTERLLAENCVALGISNIRLIKRIERLVGVVEPMLREFDEQVLRQAVQSITLLGWSVYEPTRAPSLDYLEKRRGKDSLSPDKQEAVPGVEASWNALLDACGFFRMDELDLALLDGVQMGYFDPAKVKKQASELNSQILASKLDNSFWQSWEMYHDSFDDNQTQVLDAMYGSFLRSVQHITPLNLNSTIALFKALGRPEQAARMLKHYIESRGESRDLFNPQNYLLFGPLTDPDVAAAFEGKFATFSTERDPRTILVSMATTHSWNPEDITTLARLAVDDYYKIFKAAKGQDLRRIVNACLQFDRIMNATPEMKEISRHAKDALTRIGQESPINARRVKAYGVEVGPAEPSDPK